MRVLKDTDEKYCIEFINLECSKIEFLNHFITMKEEVLNFAHDSQFGEIDDYQLEEEEAK